MRLTELNFFSSISSYPVSKLEIGSDLAFFKVKKK